MKNVKFLATAIFATVLFVSCSNDDDTPEPVNEEEVITTLTVTLSPNGGGTAITLQTRDLDGDGPNAPVVNVSESLATGVTYSGTIVLLNETVNPPENITEEVEEEMENEKPFTEAQEREAKKIIESIVTERVFSMETTISVDNEELKKQVAKLTTAFNGLLELTEKLISEPTKDAVKKTKSGFSKLKSNKRDIINTLKNKNIIN